MENIVFYIHRTGLLSYYINPICEYLSKNYRIIVLHLDKCNGYHYAPEKSSLYDTIDLSGKSAKSIECLLKELKPKALVNLGFISIYELLMLRICKTLGIKTIFLEHGLYSKETSSLPFRKMIHNFGPTVKKNLNFLSLYLQFIIMSKNSKYELSVFWRCFRKKEYYVSKFDRALFFADYGYQKISDFFHYKNNEVDFICYPLANTNREFSHYEEIAKLPHNNDGKATFIHQPFILDGLANWSYDDEKTYVLELANRLKQYGYELSVQLHPREDIDRYKKLYQGTGVDIIYGMNRVDFKKYSLVVGCYSTALLYPIFFKIPVIIVDYPDVFEAKGSLFYPVSCSLPIKEEEILVSQYDEFCNEYLGTGNCSFENIALKIEETLQTFS